jgi:hypothetical protein
LQAIGFAILIIGTLLYNEIIDLKEKKKTINNDDNHLIKKEQENLDSKQLFNDSNVEE